MRTPLVDESHALAWVPVNELSADGVDSSMQCMAEKGLRRVER